MNEAIVLTGLSGSGKSSVGEALSHVLGWKFIDTDHLIEADYGGAITEMFANKGEPFFRETESAVLEKLARELNKAPINHVISTGGGAVIRERNREILKSLGKVIFLSAPVKVLAARLSGDTGRPLLTANDKQLSNNSASEELDRLTTKLENLLIAREAAYMEADLIVETAELAADEIAARICQSLGLQNQRL